jgi:LysR family glycine cleavage system transcriptional activator
LSSFQAANKSAEVFITTSVEDVDFRREDVDSAIRLGNGDWPCYDFDPLVANIMIPVCSPNFRRRQRITALSDLAGQPLLHSLARPDDWPSHCAMPG